MKTATPLTPALRQQYFAIIIGLAIRPIPGTKQDFSGSS